MSAAFPSCFRWAVRFSPIDSLLPSFALFSLSLLLCAFGAPGLPAPSTEPSKIVIRHKSDWNNGRRCEPSTLQFVVISLFKVTATGPRPSRVPRLAASLSVVRRHTPPTTLDWDRELDGFNSMPPRPLSHKDRTD